MGVVNKDRVSLIPNPTVYVTEFGAKGDGTTNDATAIQSAIDSVKTSGGTICFPVGIYRVLSAIQFYSNQRLIFEPGATIMQGASSLNNIMRSYCEAEWTEHNGTHDVVIEGGTFSGNNFSGATTLVGIVHCKNITFDHCTFMDAGGGWHNLEINSSKNVRVINCEFEAAQKAGGEMVQLDSDDSDTVWPWSGASHDGTGCEDVLFGECIFHDSENSVAIGNHHGSSYTGIIISGCLFENCQYSDGCIAFKTGSGAINIHGNVFRNCLKGASYTSANTFVHGNVFIDVTTAVSGSGIVKNNLINGTYTD